MSLKLLPDLEDLLEGLGLSGIATIVLLSVILPGVSEIAKPIAKAAIKGGMILYEKNKDAIAKVSKTWRDIVAEAKAELVEEQEKILESAAGSS
ncbi:MAG: DUF5132 domain-containing protein [Fischerella sp.]|nr:DUF5132 domain-containing protein [Fischerella sp.]